MYHMYSILYIYIKQFVQYSTNITYTLQYLTSEVGLNKLSNVELGIISTASQSK
jgi:hypothetical protein